MSAQTTLPPSPLQEAPQSDPDDEEGPRLPMPPGLSTEQQKAIAAALEQARKASQKVVRDYDLWKRAKVKTKAMLLLKRMGGQPTAQGPHVVAEDNLSASSRSRSASDSDRGDSSDEKEKGKEGSHEEAAAEKAAAEKAAAEKAAAKKAEKEAAEKAAAAPPKPLPPPQSVPQPSGQKTPEREGHSGQETPVRENGENKESRRKYLNKALKEWKAAFLIKEGREAKKSDIKSSSMFPLYQELEALKALDGV